MNEGESCHAHLQVSGPSIWVDGGAFSRDWGMTGEEQRLGRKIIKILLQKPEVLQKGVKRCRTEVVGEGVVYILETQFQPRTATSP